MRVTILVSMDLSRFPQYLALGPPLIVEWSCVKSERWQELKDVSINEDLLGKSLDKHHQKCIENNGDFKPLPILIISSRTSLLT